MNEDRDVASGRETGWAYMSCVFIEVIYPLPKGVFMEGNHNRAEPAMCSHCSTPISKLKEEVSTVRWKSWPFPGIAKVESWGQNGELFPGTTWEIAEKTAPMDSVTVRTLTWMSLPRYPFWVPSFWNMELFRLTLWAEHLLMQQEGAMRTSRYSWFTFWILQTREYMNW